MTVFPLTSRGISRHGPGWSTDDAGRPHGFILFPDAAVAVRAISASQTAANTTHH
jgi:hypothetical protein